jgi:hypothetical protein
VIVLLLCANEANAAGLTLSVEISSGTPAGLLEGQRTELSLWLRGERTATISSVEVEFAPLTGGAVLTDARSGGDGFDESPAATAGLAVANDGSLLDDDRFIGLTTSTGAAGILPGIADVRLGYLWVQAPVGSTSFALDFAFAEILDSGVNSINFTPQGLAVPTPEPTCCSLIGLAGLALTARRRAVR